MACGCTGDCGCIILDDGATTSVVNVGSTFTVSAIQFISSVVDSNCIDLAVAGGILGASLIVAAPVGSVVALSCGAGGLQATITLDPEAGLEDTGLGLGIKIDPASTAPVTLSVDGLRVDCCEAGGAGELIIADTDTINISNALDILSAEVIIDPASPIPITSSASGLSVGPNPGGLVSEWRTVFRVGGYNTGGAGAGTYVLGTDDSGGNLGGAGTHTAPIFYYDPSAFDIAGYTTELRITGAVHYNSIAAGVNFVFDLVPITSGGGVGAMTYATGATIATTPNTSAPAGGYGVTQSPAVTAPVALAPYLLVYTTSGAIAVNNFTRIDAIVEVRYV